MNEEMNNQEVELVEEIEIYEEPEKSGNGFLKVLGGVAVLATAAVAAVCYKNRDKIKEKRIEKLRKQGYVVYKHEEDQPLDFERVHEETDEE